MTRQEFWMRAYIAALESDKLFGTPSMIADCALRDLDERYPIRSGTECKISKEMMDFVKGY